MAFELNQLVRENIRSLKPYSSARDEFEGSAEVFLDANENAFGSPVGDDHSRYPDPLQLELKKQIALEKNLRPEQIFLGNGSDEAIDLLERIFCQPGKDNILVCPPTYGMYEVVANINDVSILEAPLTEEFQLDADLILNTANDSTKVVFLCSPNNPTGNLMKRHDILRIAESFNGIVAVDEAYIDFAKSASLIEELGNFPNLLVMQTFSKAWGLAGIRIGAAFAGSDIIDLFNKVKPPYNVSRAGQEVLKLAFERKEKVEENVRNILAERASLEKDLSLFDTVESIYPSDANFLLVKVTKAKGLYNHLISEGIVVRDRSRILLCDECLRITIGTPEENKTLLSALKKYETSSIH